MYLVQAEGLKEGASEMQEVVESLQEQVEAQSASLESMEESQALVSGLLTLTQPALFQRLHVLEDSVVCSWKV